MASYKLSIVLGLSFIVLTVAGPIPKEFQDVAPEIRRTCLEQTGANIDFVEKTANGEFVEDDKIKCYFKCELEQFGLITRKGQLRWDIFIRIAPPSLVPVAKDISKNCSDIAGASTDACEIAFKAVKCAYNVAPDKYFVM